MLVPTPLILLGTSPPCTVKACGPGQHDALLTTTMRSERFSTKLEQIEQIHARNFLKEAVEHALLANLKPCVKRLPNTCLVKNP
jgi:hypothetical protein